MYLEGYEFNKYDEEIMFMAKKETHDQDKGDDKEEVVLPTMLVYGVTMTLCGVFLMAIPVPACKDWGARMIMAGVSACASTICPAIDENDKNKKEK